MSTKTRYSEQFKKEAVRLVTQEGYSHKKAGDAVGVTATTIRTWVDRFGESVPQRTVFASQKDELERRQVEICRNTVAAAINECA